MKENVRKEVDSLGLLPLDCTVCNLHYLHVYPFYNSDFSSFIFFVYENRSTLLLPIFPSFQFFSTFSISLQPDSKETNKKIVKRRKEIFIWNEYNKTWEGIQTTHIGMKMWPPSGSKCTRTHHHFATTDDYQEEHKRLPLHCNVVETAYFHFPQFIPSLLRRLLRLRKMCG